MKMKHILFSVLVILSVWSCGGNDEIEYRTVDGSFTEDEHSSMSYYTVEPQLTPPVKNVYDPSLSLDEQLEKRRGREDEVKLIMEYAYFEGQKDYSEGLIRIGVVDGKLQYTKSPWD